MSEVIRYTKQLVLMLRESPLSVKPEDMVLDYAASAPVAAPIQRKSTGPIEENDGFTRVQKKNSRSNKTPVKPLATNRKQSAGGRSSTTAAPEWLDFDPSAESPDALHEGLYEIEKFRLEMKAAKNDGRTSPVKSPEKSASVDVDVMFSNMSFSPVVINQPEIKESRFAALFVEDASSASTPEVKPIPLPETDDVRGAIMSMLSMPVFYF